MSSSRAGYRSLLVSRTQTGWESTKSAKRAWESTVTSGAGRALENLDMREAHWGLPGTVRGTCSGQNSFFQKFYRDTAREKRQLHKFSLQLSLYLWFLVLSTSPSSVLCSLLHLLSILFMFYFTHWILSTSFCFPLITVASHWLNRIPQIRRERRMI